MHNCIVVISPKYGMGSKMIPSPREDLDSKFTLISEQLSRDAGTFSRVSLDLEAIFREVQVGFIAL